METGVIFSLSLSDEPLYRTIGRFGTMALASHAEFTLLSF